MTEMLIGIIAAAFAVLLGGFVATRLSLRKEAKEKAYWQSIHDAEEAYYKHVYAKYLNA